MTLVIAMTFVADIYVVRKRNIKESEKKIPESEIFYPDPDQKLMGSIVSRDLHPPSKFCGNLFCCFS